VRSLSIRWRLTLWNTAALAVLLVAVGSLVYVLLRHAMYAQMDRVLLAQFQELQNDERVDADYELRLRHWIDEFHEHLGLFCVVYDSEGNVYARTEQLAERSVPPAPRGDPHEARYASIALPLVGRQRSLTQGMEAGGRRFTVVLMAPLYKVDQELNRVAAVLLGVLPLALLSAGGIGYVLARTALSPIDHLRKAADQITAERLDQRLEVARPDDELGRLGQTINAMIARLERSFAEIRRFTGDASHELRTPVAVIRTEAEVAMNKPPDPDEYRTFVGNILEECEHLTKLTDQLLTLSREDAGVAPFTPASLDLSALTNQAADMMRPLAETKQQTLVVQADAAAGVVGDAGRLRQVVHNLLDNAIKYTPEGGRIEVTVRSHDDMVVLTVRDTGIGIAAEHLPHVFERFYRVDKARSRDEGGTGLGLSIVQSIVLAHGGRVDMTSVVGEGATCRVWLPRNGRRPA